MAKKQKIRAGPEKVEESHAHEGDQEEGFADEQSHDEKVFAATSQSIEEGWEDVGKDEGAAEVDPEFKLLEEPVQIEGAENKKAKVLEESGEAGHQPEALCVPSMLAEDW